MTLTEFLLARIAEDEAAAWSAGRLAEFDTSDKGWQITLLSGRVAADAEGKRRIVTGDGGRIQVSGYLLGVLALPYADHPDCRPEWRP